MVIAKWIYLLQTCTPLALSPFTAPKNTRPSEQTEAAFSPALWGVVLLASAGSVLALGLWIVIYRRHTRNHRTAEDEPAEPPLQKTDAPATVHSLLLSEINGHAGSNGGAPAHCQHLHTGAQSSAPMWGEVGSACEEHEDTKPDGGGWSWGLKGSAVRQETVPLHATELGGTALVTTKTL